MCTELDGQDARDDQSDADAHEPGERLVLDATQAISLRLGDAGSVMVSINDGPSQSPGGPGEVVELEVTAENVGRLSG